MVLMIALIVLVAMTLAGLAIIRSVDTTNLIAGNLAFKQSALNASDNGIEQALVWLNANRADLATTNANAGYFSIKPGETDPTKWDNDNWIDLAMDASGNTVSYVIHRLCEKANTHPNDANCALDTSAGGDATEVREGDSATIGAPPYASNPRVYYRITSRVAGPKSTVTYTQAIVAVEI